MEMVISSSTLEESDATSSLKTEQE
jgi:hypothetical protein